MKILLTFLIVIHLLNVSITQNIQDEKIIKLNNPSFEDTPKPSAVPKGWESLGQKSESEPDVHPGNFWNVNNMPYHGNTYLGLVTRSNKTWECISQLLSQPLSGGKCYSFSAFLSVSPYYISAVNIRDNYPEIRRSDEEYNFKTPVILRILGSNSRYGKKELLAISPKIENENWQKFDFILKPDIEYKFLILEAYYSDDIPANGHILIDNASDIIVVECK